MTNTNRPSAESTLVLCFRFSSMRVKNADVKENAAEDMIVAIGSASAQASASTVNPIPIKNRTVLIGLK